MTGPARKTLPMPEGDVSTLEWDGPGPLLHFAHATGFNAETYRSILDPLGARFRIVAIDQRGHGFSSLPTTPGLAKNWTVYRDDLIAVLERLGDGPAILSGHSMGGTVSVMAAARRPDLVRGLVLFEPVMLPHLARPLQRVARLFGVNLGPNPKQAEQRRDTFPSPEAALRAYTGRGAFRTWPGETIADYLKGGLVADGQSWRLACKPAWEAETFRGAPYGVARLARRLKCPVILVRGGVGSACLASEAALFARAGAHLVKAAHASHFLPMEYPDLVRHEIERLAFTSPPQTVLRDAPGVLRR